MFVPIACTALAASVAAVLSLVCCFRVKPNTLRIVARFNSTCRVARPGWRWSWPLIEEVSPAFPLLAQREDVLNMLATTADGKPVAYSATLLFDAVPDEAQLQSLGANQSNIIEATMELYTARATGALIAKIACDNFMTSLADIAQDARPVIAEGIAHLGLKLRDVFIVKAYLIEQRETQPASTDTAPFVPSY